MAQVLVTSFSPKLRMTASTTWTGVVLVKEVALKSQLSGACSSAAKELNLGLPRCSRAPDLVLGDPGTGRAGRTPTRGGGELGLRPRGVALPAPARPDRGPGDALTSLVLSPQRPRAPWATSRRSCWVGARAAGDRVGAGHRSPEPSSREARGRQRRPVAPTTRTPGSPELPRIPVTSRATATSCSAAGSLPRQPRSTRRR